jgi:ribonuclease HII
VAGLADSKALTPAVRRELAAALRSRALGWSIGLASPAEIDALNILQATLLAMRRAVAGLALAPGHVEIDGNRLPRFEGLTGIVSAEAVVRGDASRAAISAASILAKTVRDTLMEHMDMRFPAYGFAIHKGYPTAAHLAALRAHGPSAVHRMSFGPVKSLSP